MKEIITQKITETEDYLENLKAEATQLQSQFNQLQQAEQQLLGRLQTYKEILELEAEPTLNPTLSDVDS